ncbi:hypothetical protein ACS5PN_09490 [Roseateles sp. NT4]|uniref:hypothetical protein n=1 Tax=Roseateles sp. NT4 TaxID=3453715 RepID=UPI003EEF6607
MKIVLAFIVAAIVPATLMTLWYLYGQFSMFPSDDPYIWVRTKGVLGLFAMISSAHVVLLGLPAYALLRWRNAVRWWSILASSFLLGAAPTAIWSWPLRYADLKTSATFDGVQTMIDGNPTTAGWLQYGQGVLFFGAWGLISGLAFWLALRATSHNRSLHRTAFGVR